jgi:hypothetical protein
LKLLLIIYDGDCLGGFIWDILIMEGESLNEDIFLYWKELSLQGGVLFDLLDLYAIFGGLCGMYGDNL